MNKQMMNMDELEQVNGGNIFTDAWDWICEKAQEVVLAPAPFAPKIPMPTIRDFPIARR